MYSNRFLQEGLQSPYAETQASLNGAERRVRVQGDLSMSHSTPKSQLNDHSLLGWNLLQCCAYPGLLKCVLHILGRIIIARHLVERFPIAWLYREAYMAAPHLVNTQVTSDRTQPGRKL